jgi:hypothetical protein
MRATVAMSSGSDIPADCLSSYELVLKASTAR